MGVSQQSKMFALICWATWSNKVKFRMTKLGEKAYLEKTFGSALITSYSAVTKKKKNGGKSTRAYIYT